MKTSSISRVWEFRSIACKIMMVLVLITMVGSIDVMSAFGDDRGGKHDKGRNEHRSHYAHGRRGYYAPPPVVYAPPPVVYAPPPQPGISIFLPIR
ncbi:MAG: hypothetical protein ACLPN1_00155 [Dissulfurispiraceae bacterium]|jgi:hypothetical protein